MRTGNSKGFRNNNLFKAICKGQFYKLLHYPSARSKTKKMSIFEEKKLGCFIPDKGKKYFANVTKKIS